MIPRKTAIAASLIVSAALVLTGCASSGSASSSSKADAKTATSLADFGSLKDLAAAASKEGKLNVIALPRDWANYGAVIDGFKKLYPKIKVTELSPDSSSAEEIQAAKTNAGLDTAPDVFDLGQTVALQNTAQFAPYKVKNWAEIPTSMKDAKGLWYGDYGGYMSIGYDSSKFSQPKKLDDLLKSEYKGSVALNGDPTEAGAAFAAVGLATVQSGGTLSNFQPGIDFFKKMNQSGNLLKVDVTTATVASGETPVVFDWDYLNAAHTADNPNWKVAILPGTGYAAYYNQAINKNSAHPAAARLWQEYLYSDKVQNLWLKGGARPVRATAMQKAGTLDMTLWNKLPKAPTKFVIPTQKQSDAAGTLLGSTWASAIK